MTAALDRIEMKIIDKVKFLDDISDQRWKPELLRVTQELSSLTQNKAKRPSLSHLIKVFSNPQTYKTLYHVNKHYGIAAYFCGALVTLPLLIYRISNSNVPVADIEFIEFFEFAILVGFFFHYFFFNPNKVKSSSPKKPKVLAIPDYNFLLFFDTEVKSSIDSKAKQCTLELSNADSALLELECNLRNAINSNEIKEFSEQVEIIKSSKLEILKIQALIAESKQVFQNDDDKVKVLQDFVNLNSIKI